MTIPKKEIKREPKKYRVFNENIVYHLGISSSTYYEYRTRINNFIFKEIQKK